MPLGNLQSYFVGRKGFLMSKVLSHMWPVLWLYTLNGQAEVKLKEAFITTSSLQHEDLSAVTFIVSLFPLWKEAENRGHQ